MTLACPVSAEMILLSHARAGQLVVLCKKEGNGVTDAFDQNSAELVCSSASCPSDARVENHEDAVQVAQGARSGASKH